MEDRKAHQYARFEPNLTRNSTVIAMISICEQRNFCIDAGHVLVTSPLKAMEAQDIVNMPAAATHHSSLRHGKLGM